MSTLAAVSDRLASARRHLAQLSRRVGEVVARLPLPERVYGPWLWCLALLSLWYWALSGASSALPSSAVCAEILPLVPGQESGLSRLLERWAFQGLMLVPVGSWSWRVHAASWLLRLLGAGAACRLVATSAWAGMWGLALVVAGPVLLHLSFGRAVDLAFAAVGALALATIGRPTGIAGRVLYGLLQFLIVWQAPAFAWLLVWSNRAGTLASPQHRWALRAVVSTLILCAVATSSLVEHIETTRTAIVLAPSLLGRVIERNLPILPMHGTMLLLHLADLRGAVWPVLVLGAGAAVWWRGRKRPVWPSRGLVWASAALALAVQRLLCAPDLHLATDRASSWWMSMDLMLAVPAIGALPWLGRRLSAAGARPTRLAALFRWTRIAVLAGPVVLILAGTPGADRARWHVTTDYARSVLLLLPSGVRLAGESEDLDLLRWSQLTENLRPDVLVDPRPFLALSSLPDADALWYTPAVDAKRLGPTYRRFGMVRGPRRVTRKLRGAWRLLHLRSPQQEAMALTASEAAPLVRYWEAQALSAAQTGDQTVQNKAMAHFAALTVSSPAVNLYLARFASRRRFPEPMVRRHMTHAIATEPLLHDGWLEFGRAAVARGHDHLAAPYFERAAALRLNPVPVIYELKAVAERLGQQEQVLRLAQYLIEHIDSHRFQDPEW